MTGRSWIRNLFARPPGTVRTAPARCRPTLEALEDRIALSLTPPGYYSADGQEPGIPAPPGTYVAISGATAPTLNPVGYYTNEPASVEPIAAPLGFYVDTEGAISPKQAPLGSYVPVTGASAPTLAPPGTYVDTLGAISATPAPLGSFVPVAGAIAPTLAPPGYYVPTLGAAQPTAAPPGSYVPTEGATQPTPVPPGTTSGLAASSFTLVQPIIRDPIDPTKTALVVVGTPGNDNIVIKPGGPGMVRVTLNGLAQGSYRPTGRVIVYGQAGDDNIRVAGRVRVPDWLFGGAGNDQVRGGGGASVLVGEDGDDRMQAGPGRDLILGGRGADQLQDRAGKDLLIAGPTAFDADHAALRAIRAEWTSARDYATRVANLKGGGSGLRANGDSFLTVSGPTVTVFDDGAVDQLQGGLGMDWYFANLSGGVLDQVSGLVDSEVVEELGVLAP